MFCWIGHMKTVRTFSKIRKMGEPKRHLTMKFWIWNPLFHTTHFHICFNVLVVNVESGEDVVLGIDSLINEVFNEAQNKLPSTQSDIDRGESNQGNPENGAYKLKSFFPEKLPSNFMQVEEILRDLTRFHTNGMMKYFFHLKLSRCHKRGFGRRTEEEISSENRFVKVHFKDILLGNLPQRIWVHSKIKSENTCEFLIESIYSNWFQSF